MGFFAWMRTLILGRDKLEQFDQAYSDRVEPSRGERRSSRSESKPVIDTLPGPESEPTPFDARGTLEALARRLGLEARDLEGVVVRYHTYKISKRKGGHRTINAPDDLLKQVQRRVLRRLLKPLKVHPAAIGFEANQSIVTHARGHAGCAVVVCMDIKKFFDSTQADRVQAYFQKLGWSGPALQWLVQMTTYEGGLPQGAPTSPRLSNLVNYMMDARLWGLASSLNATYSRYADDLAFSFRVEQRQSISVLLRSTKRILAESGYRLHQNRKLHIRRQHQRQSITGLVVNGGVNLSRSRRRWLRAVAHRIESGQEATLSQSQLDGWRALEKMVLDQST
jgi:RNA-directed DNA polymerase